MRHENVFIENVAIERVATDAMQVWPFPTKGS